MDSNDAHSLIRVRVSLRRYCHLCVYGRIATTLTTQPPSVFVYCYYPANLLGVVAQVATRALPTRLIVYSGHNGHSTHRSLSGRRSDPDDLPRNATRAADSDSDSDSDFKSDSDSESEMNRLGKSQDGSHWRGSYAAESYCISPCYCTRE